jgi:hypothetical protein
MYRYKNCEIKLNCEIELADRSTGSKNKIKYLYEITGKINKPYGLRSYRRL